MSRKKLICKNCKIESISKETPLGPWIQKYVQKLRKVYIREYFPEKQPKSYRDKKGKFKNRWISIGLFCTKCNRFIPDENIRNLGLTRVFDENIEKLTFI